MSQELLARIESLERSRRRWKRLALGSWAALALCLLAGTLFVTFQARRAYAMAQEERARAEAAQQEAQAQRDRAEQARPALERAK
jgi:type VI protein secretion system component VasK